MAAVTAWPRYLPESPIRYQETPMLVSLMSPVDAGLPKTRRVFTKNIRMFEVVWEMDWDQVQWFDEWFYGELKGGTESFRGLVYRDRNRREAEKKIQPDSLKYTWISAENFNVAFNEVVWADF